MRSVWKRLCVLVLALLAAAVLAGPAYGYSNKIASGRGSTAEFVCPSGVTVPADINFFAQKQKGTLFGSFNVFGSGFPSDTGKFGGVSSGSVNQNRYSLQGILDFDMCGGTN